MSQRAIIAIVLLALFSAGAVYIASGDRLPDTGLEQQWETRIEKVGGSAAYAEFAATVRDLSPGERHSLSHAFGKALYTIESLPGLSVCDEQFSFGCAHAFIGQAIVAQGLSVVDELSKECTTIDQFLPTSGCDHSIGHGLLAYFGYGAVDLEKALSYCAGYADGHDINCSQGVFMEYNLHLMAGDGVRPYTGNAYEPCDSIRKFSGACSFWLPQWWQSALFEGDNSQEAFRKIGDLCRGMSSEHPGGREQCFGGTGFIAVHSAAGDSAGIVSRCEAAARTSQEKSACISIAAPTEYMLYTRSPAEEICAALGSSEERRACSASLK